jgi:hypothetical protein
VNREPGTVNRRTEAPFVPAWWLPGPHLQTVWGRAARNRRLVVLRRELLETPDGDELVLDHLDGVAGAPHVVLLHGLEGSSNSVYIQGSCRGGPRGWSATAMNFRSCARDPKDLDRMLTNRRPRLYHSGERATSTSSSGRFRAGSRRRPRSDRRLARRQRPAEVARGEPGAEVGRGRGGGVDAVRSRRSGRFLETTLGRLYVGNFRDAEDQGGRGRRRFEGRVEDGHPPACARAPSGNSTMRPTRPLHGFTGADDYRRASSIGFVARVATRALCLSAEDDPFCRPRRSTARAPSPRRRSTSASRGTAATSASWAGPGRGGPGTGPRSSSFWLAGALLEAGR